MPRHGQRARPCRPPQHRGTTLRPVSGLTSGWCRRIAFPRIERSGVVIRLYSSTVAGAASALDSIRTDFPFGAAFLAERRSPESRGDAASAAHGRQLFSALSGPLGQLGSPGGLRPGPWADRCARAIRAAAYRDRQCETVEYGSVDFGCQCKTAITLTHLARVTRTQGASRVDRTTAVRASQPRRAAGVEAMRHIHEHEWRQGRNGAEPLCEIQVRRFPFHSQYVRRDPYF